MDRAQTREVALMSIHPRYAEMIIRGDKHVEFRRAKIQDSTKYVVIYATAPFGMLVGAFSVTGVDESQPMDIWRRYGLGGGISRADYVAYFKNARRAFAIRIGEVYRMQEPIPLHDIMPMSRPPQSFYYVDASVIESIRQRSIKLAAAG